MAKQFRLWRWAVAVGVALPLVAAAAFLPSRSAAPHQLPAGQRFSGDYFAVGEVIDLAGDVDGDVMVAASRVRISGHVNGDVLALASELILSGDVSGDVRAAAMTVTIRGAVGKNLNVWAQRLALEPASSVGRNALVGGETLKLQGTVGGTLAAQGHRVTLSGGVGGPTAVNVGSAGILTLSETAQLAGDLTYHSSSPEQLHATATPHVGGKVVHQPLPVASQAERLRAEIFGRLLSLFGLLVVGLVLVSVMPRWCLELSDLMVRRQPWLTAAWGVVGVLAVPVVAVILFLTLIGIPLAVMAVALYFVSLYVAQAVAGITLGVLVLQRIGQGRFASPLIVPMVAGITLLALVTSLGAAGWMLRLAAVLWGFGAMLRSARSALPQWR